MYYWILIHLCLMLRCLLLQMLFNRSLLCVMATVHPCVNKASKRKREAEPNQIEPSKLDSFDMDHRGLLQLVMMNCCTRKFFLCCPYEYSQRREIVIMNLFPTLLSGRTRYWHTTRMPRFHPIVLGQWAHHIHRHRLLLFEKCPEIFRFWPLNPGRCR